MIGYIAKAFASKKPHAVASKVSEEKQTAFIAKYRALKEEPGTLERIYFVDSMHPQHQTQLAYGWILKGARKRLATSSKQKRLHRVGGINLSTYRFIYREAEKVDGQCIQSYLSQLRRAHRGGSRLHVILDNAGYHHSDAVKRHAEDLHIELHYLPAYSPNLNPIERLWKLLREEVMYNRYYKQFSEFCEATRYFLRTIGKKKRLLQRRITDKFQILKPPNFAF